MNSLFVNKVKAKLYRWLVGDSCPMLLAWLWLIRRKGVEVGKIYQSNNYFSIYLFKDYYYCLINFPDRELRRSKEIIDLARDGETLWVYAGSKYYYKREGCIFDANQ